MDFKSFAGLMGLATVYVFANISDFDLIYFVRAMLFPLISPTGGQNGAQLDSNQQDLKKKSFIKVLVLTQE